MNSQHQEATAMTDPHHAFQPTVRQKRTSLSSRSRSFAMTCLQKFSPSSALLSALIAIALMPTAFAQTFSSGSTGADGASFPASFQLPSLVPPMRLPFEREASTS